MKTDAATYRVRWRDDDGRTRSKTFRRKADAREYINRMGVHRANSTYISLAVGTASDAEWHNTWHDGRRDLRPGSRVRTESHAKDHILPAFGQVPLNQITQPMVVRWVSELVDRGLAPATVQKVFQIFAKSMKAAVSAGLILRAPLDGIELPRTEHKEMRFLSSVEVEILAGAMDPRYRALVYVLGYGGLRIGEASALRVERFDPFQGSLRIIETASEVRGQLLIGPPKTRASVRTVKLPRFVAAERRSHFANFTNGTTEEFVFQGAQGGALRSRAFGSANGPRRYLRLALHRSASTIYVTPQSASGSQRSLNQRLSLRDPATAAS